MSGSDAPPPASDQQPASGNGGTASPFHNQFFQHIKDAAKAVGHTASEVAHSDRVRQAEASVQHAASTVLQKGREAYHSPAGQQATQAGKEVIEGVKNDEVAKYHKTVKAAKEGDVGGVLENGGIALAHVHPGVLAAHGIVEAGKEAAKIAAQQRLKQQQPPSDQTTQPKK